MNFTEIAGLFARNLGTLERNLEGLEPEDFLVRIGEDGTHLNWLIGHTLLSRQNLLVTLNPAMRPDDLDTIKAAYKRGTKSSNAETVPSVHLLETLRASQPTLTHALESTDLSQPGPREGNLADFALFMAWHETYHVGQSGVLRRLTGKPGAI
jgi:uncharacterized damage-inducible protein DinB